MQLLDIDSRIRRLGGGDIRGKCVLYVMSRDQRVADNYALLAAQRHALTKKLPLAVVFCLQPSVGVRAREHFEFMLAGFTELETQLHSLQIPFMLLLGNPQDRLGALFYHVQPDAVYFDFNPLRGSQRLHRSIAESALFSVYEVDTHNVVPVWVASDKQEVVARTLRPKIRRLLADYLVEPDTLLKHPYTWHGTIMNLAALHKHIKEVCDCLTSNGQKLRFVSGEKAAKKALAAFIEQRLHTYDVDRNDPTLPGLSQLSPYLHFGQLGSARVVLEVLAAASHDTSLKAGADRLIEEIIVRKELSDNFCFYNNLYDNLLGAPQWAQNTLLKHASDPREYVYSREQFASAATHDPAWNAAQKQMLSTGKMHGYMRMYWAKKVLEWSASPAEAIATLIYLNDFYSIDGGDPNGYVGILWSVAGLHDRPWGERPVYGVVRSMVYTGLKRKFNVVAYEKAWNR